jgi:hypothetical protein
MLWKAGIGSRASERRYLWTRARSILWRWRLSIKGMSKLIAEIKFFRFLQKLEKLAAERDTYLELDHDQIV